MDTPSLHSLHPDRLRPAPTGTRAYTGAPWTLQFKEEALYSPTGAPRVCIEIKLMNNTDRGPGTGDRGANADDGSQIRLMDAITERFGPKFTTDRDFEWVPESGGEWHVLCSDHKQSYGYWKWYTDLDDGNIQLAKDRTARNSSLIPGGSTFEFLKLAFDGWGLINVVELAGKHYQFSQPKGLPNQEGVWVVWQLGQPSGATEVARRGFLGGQWR